MRLNTAASRFQTWTHEGAPAFVDTPEKELRKAVLTCLLWEDTFYEKGDVRAQRIADLCEKVSSSMIEALAYAARTSFNLRHVPLFLLVQLAKKGQQQKLPM